jgi:flagellar hook assembly protein FlgD
VAIDGDYFNRGSGAPNGMLMQNGVLESGPATGRSSLGIAADGTLTTARVSLAGAWQGNGQRLPLFLNTRAGKGKFTLYTPAYGQATPGESGVLETVIGSLPPAQPGASLSGTVTQLTTAGPTAIPAGGAVLVARGAQSIAQLRAEAPVGQQITALFSLSPDWSRFPSAIGGGPLLVRNGKPVFHASESFDPRRLNSRQPRGAIGQLRDGRIVLVAAEGTNAAYSIGMSSYELAVELSRLGAVTGFGLDAGTAAGIEFDGKLLTRPSGGSEAKLSDALVLTYSGVYAVPPSVPVLSPNGDGAEDTETLSYQLARPSQVAATLNGPSGTKIPLANDAESPGTHTFTWDGTNAGAPAPEGEWTFNVTATDDRNVATTDEQTFSLDDTLSSLTVSGGTRPTASFQLTRPANVVIRIERPTGVPVATVSSGPRVAGPQHATWRGEIGKSRASAGRYLIEVVATSSVGTSSLAALFSFRPHPRQ